MTKRLRVGKDKLRERLGLKELEVCVMYEENMHTCICCGGVEQYAGFTIEFT